MLVGQYLSMFRMAISMLPELLMPMVRVIPLMKAPEVEKSLLPLIIVVVVEGMVVLAVLDMTPLLEEELTAVIQIQPTLGLEEVWVEDMEVVR